MGQVRPTAKKPVSAMKPATAVAKPAAAKSLVKAATAPDRAVSTVAKKAIATAAKPGIAVQKQIGAVKAKSAVSATPKMGGARNPSLGRTITHTPSGGSSAGSSAKRALMPIKKTGTSSKPAIGTLGGALGPVKPKKSSGSKATVGELGGALGPVNPVKPDYAGQIRDRSYGNALSSEMVMRRAEAKKKYVESKTASRKRSSKSFGKRFYKGRKNHEDPIKTI